MKKILVIGLFCFIHGQIQANIYEYLSYNSESEKTAFLRAEKDTANKLPYFLYLNSKCDAKYISNAQNWMREIVDELKNQKIEKKNGLKKVKLIQKLLKSKYLLKYEYYSEFHQLIDQAVYNCVTGSALFALVFDEFNIPYDVQVTPNHVYLIAYPKKERFIVESTIKTTAVLVYEQKFKENYIAVLRQKGIVSLLELKNFSLDELFDKYYLREEKINLWQLIGIHYYNKTVQLLRGNAALDVFSSSQKALYFFQYMPALSTRNDALPSVSIAMEYNKFQKLLCEVLSEKPVAEEIQNHAKNYFLNRINEMYAKKVSDEQSQEFASTVRQCISDSANRIEILFNERVYALDQAVGNKKRLQIAIEAYVLNPSHERLKTELSRLLLNKLAEIHDYKQGEEELNELIKKYPTLSNLSIVAIFNLVIYSEKVMKLYSSGSMIETEKVLVGFEELIEKIDKEDPFWIELSEGLDELSSIYSEYSAIYARKSNHKKAADILDRGLKVFPNSDLLQYRRKILHDATGF